MNIVLRVLAVIALGAICLPFIAVNHMDLIATMYGEFTGNEFGASLVSMDFNGDGYDDLIVKAPLWHPDNLVGEYYEMFGKIYFYWGGPGFDNIPDFVIEGQHPYHFASYTYTSRENPMINAGDVNGDGLEDLAIPQRTVDGTRTVSVYFSRANPQTTPDIELFYPYPETRNLWIFPLGDVNNDGKDDLSLTLMPTISSTPKSILFWTDIYGDPYLVRKVEVYTNVIGVGDVNTDGCDDFILHHYNENNSSYYSFFYGDASCTLADSLVLGIDSVATDYYSTPLGDVNGDGFNDFLSWNDKIWFGGTNISSTPNVVLQRSPMLSFCYGMWPSAVRGDFNNDGYMDISGADNMIYGNSGMAGIWLGSPVMNGIADLLINPPSDYMYRNFGWGKAAGDFNGDGFCDLAFGAPLFDQGDHWHTEGRVFVHAGNAELIDTTVSNEDELISSIDSEDWSIDIYPNPLGRSTRFSVSFTGKAYQRPIDHLEMSVYNLKGQCVMRESVDYSQIKSGIDELDLSTQAAGVYLVCISESGNNRIIKKITKY